jgi:hypothetical protein
MISITIALVKLSAIGSSSVTSRDLARQLNELLTGLGQSEFHQAKMALAHAEASTTPERELTLAIGHLQSADGHFEQACKQEDRLADKAIEGSLPGWRYRAISHYKRSLPSFQMRIACKASIATIYAQLNQPALVRQHANEIAEIFLAYSGNAVATQSAGAGFNAPLTINEYRSYVNTGYAVQEAGGGPLAAQAREEAKGAESLIRALGVELPEGGIKMYALVFVAGKPFRLGKW